MITFDRVPFSATAGGGLDFGATVQAPVRGATVEAIAAAGGTVIQSTTTSDTGAYSLTNIPASTQLFLRVKAELQKSGTPGWEVRVRDNTSGDALYALDTTAFDSGTVATLTRDLNAPSGWGSSSYVGTRSAAPFALLDVVYQSMQLVLTADASAVFPELNIFWSPANVPVDGNVTLGEIDKTSFEPAGGSSPAAIYVLGAEDVDTDEFDRHVIAHEWAHYYQNVFSRNDSMGGQYDTFTRLDPRVAFSEGWSNAFAGMVNADPLYRSSYGVGQASDDVEDLESRVLPTITGRRGWYSAGSIGLVLTDLFDGAGGDNDAVQTGFGPIHSAMVSLADTPAFTGMHGFLNRLLANVPAAAADITALANDQRIRAVQPDDFAGAETYTGTWQTLPIYKIAAPGTTRRACSQGEAGRTYNRLANSGFLRLTLTSDWTGTLTATTVSPKPTANADVLIFRNGEQIASSELPGNETLPLSLPAGTYVIETYDVANILGGVPGYPAYGETCIDVALTP